MNTTWLVSLFEGAGLEQEDARRAAEATWKALLSRGRPDRAKRKKPALRAPGSRDPISSLDRLLGGNPRGLPFFDDETGRLSVTSFTRALHEAGIDWVVALAYAKVVAEAYEPEEFYSPIWGALGRKGPLDLDALRDADWSPLTSGSRTSPAGRAPKPETLASKSGRPSSASSKSAGAHPAPNSKNAAKNAANEGPKAAPREAARAGADAADPAGALKTGHAGSSFSAEPSPRRRLSSPARRPGARPGPPPRKT